MLGLPPSIERTENPENEWNIDPVLLEAAIREVAPSDVGKLETKHDEVIEDYTEGVALALGCPEFPSYFNAYFAVVDFRRSYREKRNERIISAGGNIRTYPRISDYPSLFDEQTFKETLLNDDHELHTTYTDLVEKMLEAQDKVVDAMGSEGRPVPPVMLPAAAVYADKAKIVF